MMGSKATWLSAADSKGGILEANYSLPPHAMDFPHISYQPLTHTPTRIRLRFGLHPQLEGKDHMVAAEKDCGGT